MGRGPCPRAGHLSLFQPSSLSAFGNAAAECEAKTPMYHAPMTFRSKVDAWLVVLLGGVVFGVFAVLLTVSQNASPPPPKFVFVIPFVTFGFILWSFSTT